MAANFFGHAYLIDLLLDKLQTSTPSRWVAGRHGSTAWCTAWFSAWHTSRRL
jgi:hypothetical protein